MKKKIIFGMLALIMLTFNSCSKKRKKDGFLGTTIGGTPIVKGCTDPTAANYNSSANTDNGSCIYQGQVVFFFASYSAWAGTATILSNNQTGTFTYHTSPTTCGSALDATFTLPVGTYNYTLHTTTSDKTGQVTIIKNECTLIGW